MLRPVYVIRLLMSNFAYRYSIHWCLWSGQVEFCKHLLWLKWGERASKCSFSSLLNQYTTDKWEKQRERARAKEREWDTTDNWKHGGERTLKKIVCHLQLRPGAKNETCMWIYFLGSMIEIDRESGAVNWVSEILLHLVKKKKKKGEIETVSERGGKGGRKKGWKKLNLGAVTA